MRGQQPLESSCLLTIVRGQACVPCRARKKAIGWVSEGVGVPRVFTVVLWEGTVKKRPI